LKAPWSEGLSDISVCDTQGLDTVARRNVSKGEELTIDYATFCVDCEAFDCCCGAKACRGRLTGKEYLEPWLEDVYQDHVSDYIRHLRSCSAAKKASGKIFAEELLGADSFR
jgi:hypothetical protein